MNFIKPISLIFGNLSDAKTILYSSEGNVKIQSIRCHNRSNSNIRLNLKIVALLTDPIQEAYIFSNLLLLPNQTTDLMCVSFSNSALIVPKRLKNGDNLICYSNGYQEIFDCTLDGYEEIEDV